MSYTQPNDKQLRSRVKLLGSLLGNVLLSQAGKRVYTAVEALRKGYISLHRREDPAKRKRLEDDLKDLDRKLKSAMDEAKKARATGQVKRKPNARRLNDITLAEALVKAPPGSSRRAPRSGTSPPRRT